jgi:hypothetical protein
MLENLKDRMKKKAKVVKSLWQAFRTENIHLNCVNFILKVASNLLCQWNYFCNTKLCLPFLIILWHFKVPLCLRNSINFISQNFSFCKGNNHIEVKILHCLHFSTIITHYCTFSAQVAVSASVWTPTPICPWTPTTTLKKK